MMLSDDFASSATWTDAELHGLNWVEGGRDVALRIRLAGDEQDHVLTCQWTSALQVSLAFRQDQGGVPLTWETTFSRQDNGTWFVVLDFASNGQVRLKCNDLVLKRAELP